MRFNETALANYASTQFQRQASKPISFTNSYTLVEEDGIIMSEFKGSSSDPLMISAKEEMSMYDTYPPALFIKFFGKGTVAHENNSLVASKEIILKPGCGETINLAIGYTFDPDITTINKMVAPLEVQADFVLKSKKDGIRSPFGEQWLNVLPNFPLEKDENLRQELLWHAYNLEAMATYSQFYDETKISQGTIYDYYWGQHASARDNFQHALPLVYYNPELAKSVMRYMAKRTTPVGEIELIEYGNGYAEGMVYHASDQQLFFFLLLSEYLRVTNDYNFLSEPIEFFPASGGKKGTMMDVTEQCFRYLRYNVGVGAHGLVRLLNSDWNDNVFVAKSAAYNNVIFTGESLMNTTMALSILQNLIPSIEKYATIRNEISAQVNKVAESMKGYRKAVFDAFMKDLGDRTFARRMYFDGQSIGDENMFLEPQAYMLQIKELPIERKQALYDEMQKRIYAGEKLGARQQQTPEFEAYGLENGSRENGGFWYSLNGPAIVGVNSFNKDEAWKLFRNMTFNNYARQFPQYWTSYWSASDNVESSLMGPQEGLPDQSLDYYAIPVYCAHPHAYLLYCYYILNEHTTIDNDK